MSGSDGAGAMAHLFVDRTLHVAASDSLLSCTTTKTTCDASGGSGTDRIKHSDSIVPIDGDDCQASGVKPLG
jgi:hypothetical protein